MRKNNVDGDLEVGNFLQMNADHKDLKPSWDLWEIRGIVDDVYLIRRRGKCYRATECASVRRLNISQGIDVRSASPKFLEALCTANLWGDTVYTAWDRPRDETTVLAGLNRLLPLAKRHKKSVTAFVLTGFDTSFDQDQYRVKKLHALGVRPYVMPYESMDKADARMACFKRFVNAFFHKRMSFAEYEPWMKTKDTYQGQLFAT